MGKGNERAVEELVKMLCTSGISNTLIIDKEIQYTDLSLSRAVHRQGTGIGKLTNFKLFTR